MKNSLSISYILCLIFVYVSEIFFLYRLCRQRYIRPDWQFKVIRYIIRFIMVQWHLFSMINVLPIVYGLRRTILFLVLCLVHWFWIVFGMVNNRFVINHLPSINIDLDHIRTISLCPKRMVGHRLPLLQIINKNKIE